MIKYILLISIIIIIYYLNSKPKKCPKFKQSDLGKNLVLNEDKYILNEKGVSINSYSEYLNIIMDLKKYQKT